MAAFTKRSRMGYLERSGCLTSNSGPYLGCTDKYLFYPQTSGRVKGDPRNEQVFGPWTHVGPVQTGRSPSERQTKKLINRQPKKKTNRQTKQASNQANKQEIRQANKQTNQPTNCVLMHYGKKRKPQGKKVDLLWATKLSKWK